MEVKRGALADHLDAVALGGVVKSAVLWGRFGVRARDAGNTDLLVLAPEFRDGDTLPEELGVLKLQRLIAILRGLTISARTAVRQSDSLMSLEVVEGKLVLSEPKEHGGGVHSLQLGHPELVFERNLAEKLTALLPEGEGRRLRDTGPEPDQAEQLYVELEDARKDRDQEIREALGREARTKPRGLPGFIVRATEVLSPESVILEAGPKGTKIRVVESAANMSKVRNKVAGKWQSRPLRGPSDQELKSFHTIEILLSATFPETYTVTLNPRHLREIMRQVARSENATLVLGGPGKPVVVEDQGFRYALFPYKPAPA